MRSIYLMMAFSVMCVWGEARPVKRPPYFGLSPEERTTLNAISEDKWKAVRRCAIGAGKLDVGNKEFLVLKDDFILTQDEKDVFLFMPHGMKRFDAPVTTGGHYTTYRVPYQPPGTSKDQWGFFNVAWIDGQFVTFSLSDESPFVKVAPTTHTSYYPLPGSDQLWASPAKYDPHAAAVLVDKVMRTIDTHLWLETSDRMFRHYSKEDLEAIRHCETLARRMPNTPVARIVHNALSEAEAQVEPGRAVSKMKLLVTLSPTSVDQGGQVAAHAVIENHSSYIYYYDEFSCGRWQDWRLDNPCLEIDSPSVGCEPNIPRPSQLPPGGKLEEEIPLIANCSAGSTVSLRIGFGRNPTLWSKKLSLRMGRAAVKIKPKFPFWLRDENVGFGNQNGWRSQ